MFFLDYLKKICDIERNETVNFSCLDGCQHNVRKEGKQNWQAYIEAVFSD
jgi:hypothetical protein